MPFKVSISEDDIRSVFNTQGYTPGRAGNIDHLDVAISTRAGVGADVGLTPAARAAIWNEGMPTTPAGGSYGERIRNNLDVATGTRAAPGVEMGVSPAARAAIWNEGIPATPTAGSYGERIRANLDAAISGRATSADVGSQLDTRGVTSGRLLKLDVIAAPAVNSGTVTAAANAAGLTVDLNTGSRTVIEIRYSCGAAASFEVLGSDDGTIWFPSDTFSEPAAVTNKITGYLSARRHVRVRSPTTGISLTFEIIALL